MVFTAVAGLGGCIGFSLVRRTSSYARIIGTAYFSTSAKLNVGYDRESTLTGHKKTNAASAGSKQREQDKVPDGFEIIAAAELVIPRFFMVANYATQVMWLFAMYKFSVILVPQIVYRHEFDSVLDVILGNDLNLVVATCLPAASLAITTFRTIFNRYMLRLYLHREKDEYCAIFLGWYGITRHFFTHKDVRLTPSASPSMFRSQYRLKGRPADIDIKEFRNVRDYHQLLRYARKLQK